MSTLHFYQKWMKDSKRVNGYSYPERGKNSLISITKDLISRIYASGATYDKRDDYLAMKKCEQWLG